ncbi:MAG TPA: glutamate racemase [bacterium]|nr:glutamate racemase [bacterium]
MRKRAEKKTKRNHSIGVFDSGLGGLTVVREIRRQLPRETIVYFGDIARLPYGIKSNEQILNFSIQNTLFLLKQKIKALVIACNSSSSAAYTFLKDHFYLPMVDVITPAAEEAVRKTRKGRIGVLATHATIQSRSYEKAIKKSSSRAKIFSVPCSLFVPLVEEGWLSGKITDSIIQHYLAPLKKQRIDTLILGCTHFPMLKSRIQAVLDHGIQLVDSAKPTVEKLSWILAEKGLIYPSQTKGRLEIYVSDMPRNFKRIGERFLGEKLNHVKVVRQK